MTAYGSTASAGHQKLVGSLERPFLEACVLRRGVRLLSAPSLPGAAGCAMIAVIRESIRSDLGKRRNGGSNVAPIKRGHHNSPKTKFSTASASLGMRATT